MPLGRSADLPSPEDFHPGTRTFFLGRKVAVTGGTGFIGSHLVEQLMTLGAEPIVISSGGRLRFLQHRAGQFEFRLCNFNSLEATIAAIRGATVVLNLAAVVAGIEFNNSHPASIFHENMQSFLNVIKAAQLLDVERFLATSSACVYPRDCSIPTPEEEGFLGEPEPTNSGYGWSKRMQEYLAARYASEFGLPVAIARPYNAFGPRDNFEPSRSHVIPSLIRKAFATSDEFLNVWGDGSHSRSFLYVEDFARGLLEVAARYPHADPVNLGAQEEITIRHVAESIAKIASELRGRRIAPRFDPTALTGQPRRMCDTRKAKRILGFEARISFAEGIQRTVEWFVANENNSLPAHI